MLLDEVNPKKIIISCQQILAETISDQAIILPESTDPQEARYFLNLKGFNTFGTTDRDIPVSVVPFLINYWLHFSIQFKVYSKGPGSKKYDYYLAGVSIAVFYGQATDEDKLLMFRAEWDNKEDDETSIIHPQPHWHIHNIGSSVKAGDISDFNTFLGMKQEEPPDFLEELAPESEEILTSKIANLSGFHFAMSAGRIFGQPNKHVLTEANLKIWLKESITHISEQLKYCQ